LDARFAALARMRKNLKAIAEPSEREAGQLRSVGGDRRLNAR